MRQRRAISLVVMAMVLGWSGCSDEGSEDSHQEPPGLAEDIFAPMGQILPSATEEQRQAFDRGRQLATHRFSPEEGLGPKFNADSCASCHLKPVLGGAASRYRNFFLVGRQLEDGAFLFGPGDGIVHTYGLPQFGPARPPMATDMNVIAQRSPIPLFGMGLIAEIPDAVILANADPDDESGDGISGRVNWDRGFVGRFGRKAQTVSIEGFVRSPLFNHVGITTDPLSEDMLARLPVPSDGGGAPIRGLNAGEAALMGRAQAAPPSEPLSDEDDVADPEISADQLFDLVSFTMLLAAPKPSEPTAQSLRGEQLFYEVGCTSCHIPELESPRGMIPLYSDLLLHDMGPELADGIVMGLATGSEFRTQPLWGVAAVGPWLHDGRADTLDEAIRWHGGEAEEIRRAYENLEPQQRRDMIAFLESLGGAEVMTAGSLLPAEEAPGVGELGGPMPGLDDDESQLWLAGRQLFDRDTLITEGLGNPHFNSDSCRSCHGEPTLGGAGPIDVAVIRGGSLSEEGQFIAPSGGTIFDRLAIPGATRREASEEVNLFEFRMSPPLFGIGLIESIDEEAIVANADPHDLTGDGIRGRVSYLADDQIGRFGWKGDVPSIHEFVRDALSNEIGQTVPDEEGLRFGDLPPQGEPAQASAAQIEALTFYLQKLGPPPRKGEHPRGEALFDEIGCTACHMESLPGSGGPVPLYSDLLLHDIQADDHRGIPTANAEDREFRTPPLWGLRHSGPYLHDGSASTIETAIRSHHGTAAASREAFEGLSADDRQAVLEFLETL